MQIKINKPTVLTISLLLIFIAVSLYLRIALPFDKVFSESWIKFTGTDTYFYMRLVDNIVHNYPKVIQFDPFNLYPNASTIINPPFFHFFLSTIIYILSLGNPNPEIIDKVSVYFPPVLAALCIIPVYFIGKIIFNRAAGLIASGLFAISPGEILGRSILGFTDQHIAEVLFSTTSVLFLVSALYIYNIKNNYVPAHIFFLKKISTKYYIFCFLSGLFLGIYLITWYGALLMVLILFCFMVLQLILDHLRNTNSIKLVISNTIIFIVATLIFLPVSNNPLIIAPLIIAILVPAILYFISILFKKYSLNVLFFPLSVVVIGIISTAIFFYISPATFKNLISNLYIFSWPIGTTIQEMQPILFPNNRFAFWAVWLNFTTAFFLSLITIGYLVYKIIKNNNEFYAILLVWSLIILAATLSMRRFAYYFSVNAALLASFSSLVIFEFIASKLTTKKQLKSKQKQKRKAESFKTSEYTYSPFSISLGLIVVFLISFLPNIQPALNTAKAVPFAPSNSWCEALNWMKENTPDPFNNPKYYYTYYENKLDNQTFIYPESVYSVAAWWDYGYWITRIAHRIPISNPGTNHNGEAYFFMSDSEKNAAEFLKRLKSKYIIIDYEIINIHKKFFALAELSGHKLEDYVDVFYERVNGKLAPVIYYFPEYYKTIISRLYNFDAAPAIPQDIDVIIFSERITKDGQIYKEVIEHKSFKRYEDAISYVGNQSGINKARIVSKSQFITPIPLPALTDYKLVFTSSNSIMFQGIGRMPEIKIFEFNSN